MTIEQNLLMSVYLNLSVHITLLIDMWAECFVENGVSSWVLEQVFSRGEHHNTPISSEDPWYSTMDQGALHQDSYSGFQHSPDGRMDNLLRFCCV